MRILIVEDDPLLSNLYDKVCQKNGFETIIARDGEEGVRMALEQKPDFILLDMNLPKLNGIEVFEKLLHSPQHTTPVVFLTNNTDKKQQEMAMAMGAKDYVSKAMKDPEEILAIIKKYSNN